jgi:hypothetical protein
MRETNFKQLCAILKVIWLWKGKYQCEGNSGEFGDQYSIKPLASADTTTSQAALYFITRMGADEICHPTQQEQTHFQFCSLTFKATMEPAYSKLRQQKESERILSVPFRIPQIRENEVPSLSQMVHCYVHMHQRCGPLELTARL